MHVFVQNMLFKVTYQCKRKVCKNADNPSIMTKIAKVHADKIRIENKMI